MALMPFDTARLDPALPIFGVWRGARAFAYSPGMLAPLSTARLASLRQALGGEPADELDCSLANAFRRHAHMLRQRYEELGEPPFRPECLTVYLSNACGGGCRYCYAAPVRGRQSAALLGIDATAAAARLVAGACAARGQPFRLVVHGGGEPTEQWARLREVVDVTRQIAATVGLPWQSHLATNGMVSEHRLGWLAEAFDHIGLSCDGPPSIHDRQRPDSRGAPTSTQVAATARRLHQLGAAFTVRATITPDSVRQQVAIVDYCHAELGAQSLRFEPVYRAGNGMAGFRPDDADVFVEGFLSAQQRAAESGLELSYSGVRLDEVHGPYCDVLRNVLHLAPDGAATACFFAVTPAGTPVDLGRTGDDGVFVLDEARLAEHSHRTRRIPPRCRDCLNLYHCCRDCPDHCMLAASDGEPGFRCRVNRELSLHWLWATLDERGEVSRAASMSAKAKAGEGDALLTSASLPEPIWRRRPFDCHGPDAWALVRDALATGDPAAPISIYVHVPFCDRRCSFCDCYSVPLRTWRSRVPELVHALADEAAAWGSAPGMHDRRVTTIHFGGGTPLALPGDGLETVVRAVARLAAADSTTEWAIETTAASLAPGRLDRLQRLGFTRLHVGVQTLDVNWRQRLGRRLPAAEVCLRLGMALDRGFVVSVDLLYGLPGTGEDSLKPSLGAMVATGVHGVSLYRLHHTQRNDRWFAGLDTPTGEPRAVLAQFAAAEAFLRHHAFRKNHFAHFARGADRNLYYNHARRGEALIALGPTADGVVGNVHYRHGELPHYLGAPAPGLNGALRETSAEASARGPVADLMSGRVGGRRWQTEPLNRLRDRWTAAGLLGAVDGENVWELTAAGSRDVAILVRELEVCCGGLGD